MTHLFDELSKSLEESVPRRESLRLLGSVLTGALLSPLGIGAAWAAPRTRDTCTAFCQCRGTWEQNQCLTACRACSDPSRLCGNCANGYTCSDDDIYNCGVCGNRCDEAGPHEAPVCESGLCYYACDDYAIECDGTCTNILLDTDNCGACGNACISPLAPYCNYGECSYCQPGLTLCGLWCTDLSRDTSNCGACGHSCGYYQSCIAGHCETAAP